MSRSKFIEVDGKKYELFFSTRTLIKISERVGGDINNLGSWIGGADTNTESEKGNGGNSTSDGNTAEMLSRFSVILADLANGAVIKNNAGIALGLEQGEKKPLYPDDYFIDILNVSDILTYKEEIFEALNMGTNYEIPEGVEVEEKDPDLAELEREKKADRRAAT